MSEAWAPIRTRADFEARVELGVTCESQTLDFKGGFEVYDKRDGPGCGPRELALDISMFGNTDGGTLLVGVVEKVVDGRGVAEGIRAMADFDDRERRIRNAVRRWLVPSTIALEVIEVPVIGGPIVAINVPPSERLVSVWDSQTTIHAVVRRGANKHYLNPDEYEAHLMDGSRAKKIAFDRVCRAARLEPGGDLRLARPVLKRFAPTVQAQAEVRVALAVQLVAAAEHEFTLGFPSNRSRNPLLLSLPYGLIREVWRSAEGPVTLLLDCDVAWNGNRVSLC